MDGLFRDFAANAVAAIEAVESELLSTFVTESNLFVKVVFINVDPLKLSSINTFVALITIRS